MTLADRIALAKAGYTAAQIESFCADPPKNPPADPPKNPPADPPADPPANSEGEKFNAMLNEIRAALEKVTKAAIDNSQQPPMKTIEEQADEALARILDAPNI